MIVFAKTNEGWSVEGGGECCCGGGAGIERMRMSIKPKGGGLIGDFLIYCFWDVVYAFWWSG